MVNLLRLLVVNLIGFCTQEKAFSQNKEYILPLRLDETEIPGINSTTGYIDFNIVGIDRTISLLEKKLNEK